MEKILALLGEIKGWFTTSSEKLDKVVSAEERVKALAADLAASHSSHDTTKAELETERKTLTDTKATLQTAQEEITTLKASVESEKARANEVIASQGLPLDQIPAGSTGQAKQEGTAFAQYRKLLETDPAAAGAFYAKNADAILSSRPK